MRVGGDDDYEGSRQRLRLFQHASPLSAAQRDLSFDLFETAVAAAEARAEAGSGTSLGVAIVFDAFYPELLSFAVP